MWRILKAEAMYSWWALLPVVSLAPLLVLYNLQPWEDLSTAYLAFWMIFLIIQFWRLRCLKENRVRQQMQLPLPAKQVALFRLGLVLVPPLGVTALYALIATASGRHEPAIYGKFTFITALLLFCYALNFLARDLFQAFLRRSGLTRERMLTFLLVPLLGLNLLGILVMLQPHNYRGLLSVVGKAVHWLVVDNPLPHGRGPAMVLAAGLMMAALTLVTFSRRRAYLE